MKYTWANVLAEGAATAFGLVLAFIPASIAYPIVQNSPLGSLALLLLCSAIGVMPFFALAILTAI